MSYCTLYTRCEINNINGDINLSFLFFFEKINLSFLIIKNDSIYNVMILFIVLNRKQVSRLAFL